MNNLQIKEIATINSKEVAKMMEIRHSDLMRKIEGINRDFENAKMRSQEYWIESTYKTEGNNKTYKCYEVTKMGCEFLAHKSTGTKGNIFTARYMQKFNEMEKTLKNIHTESYMIDDPIERAKKWIEEETVRQEQAKLIDEQKPKVEFYEKVLDSKNTYTTTQIAKDYGMSAINFNSLLKDLKVQYRNNGQWILYSKYQNEGYTESKTSISESGISFINTRWTQKGREFLYEILKKNGYEPKKNN